MVQHFNSENEKFQFFNVYFGMQPGRFLFENKRFAYSVSSSSTPANWITSKLYRFPAIGGVIKKQFLYQVFLKGKYIFTPGVSNIFQQLIILTYRSNPSYKSIVILIFLSVRSNTDQIRMKLRPCKANRMCSRNRVLSYSCTS